MTDDELDETTFPAWRDAIARHPGGTGEPRSYPGYPRVALPEPRAQRLGAMSLERALASRRSPAALTDDILDARTLGRILHLAHGITGEHARGPVPSAGGLQALELYLATWSAGWLAPGWHHYDRTAHALATIATGATRDDLATNVPSLALLPGGAALAIVVGDHARVAARYTTRARRFLALEAGHLAQNLCLAATASHCAAVPLGGFFDRALARRLQLPRSDLVLATCVLGTAR